MLQQSNGERNSLQQMVVKSPNSHMKKKTIKPWPLTHKIQTLTQTTSSQIQDDTQDLNVEVKSQNYKYLRRKHRIYLWLK